MSIQQPILRKAGTQAGAVIVTVCLVLLFLLGFMGIALDFGHMFVVKTELQTSMDSCALAGAQELDKQPLSIVRARNAGRTAANMNHANFQKYEWTLEDENFVFRDKDYIITADPIAARYIECSFEMDNVTMWLMHALGAFIADTSKYPQNRSVFASAVATVASGSACPIPVALLPRPGKTAAENYGFTIGEWVKILDVDNNSNPYPQPGEMGWFNIDGTQGAQQTKDQLSENSNLCDVVVDDETELSTLGAKQGVAPQWNGRFGLYRGADGPSTISPDLSGYSYDDSSFPAKFNAWPDFVTKRVTNEPNAGVGGGWRPTTAAMHKQYGYNRRLVTVPVLTATNTIQDFACMFMLEPMIHPLNPVYLEFRGLASSVDSPCTTNGLAGALAGPNVPTLVR